MFPKTLSLTLKLLLVAGLAIFFLSNSATSQAEIATITDWIGLYLAGTITHTTAGTVGGNSWKYANSCSQIPGSVPQLSSAGNDCNFTLPSTPGLYEFRLYANGYGIPPKAGSSDALIAQSKIFTVGLDISSSTCTPSGQNLQVNLNWPALAGDMAQLAVVRSSGGNTISTNVSPLSRLSYQDIVPAGSAPYIYYLSASNNRGSAPSFNTATVDSSCHLTFGAYTPIPPTPPPGGSPSTQCPSADTGSRRIAIGSGLLSLRDTLGQADTTFSSPSNCIVGERATLLLATNFSTLKSLYYDQAKFSAGDQVVKENPLVGNKTEGNIPVTGTSDHLYLINPNSGTGEPGNLTLNTNIPGNRSGVVFVSGDLNIKTNIIASGNSSGLVFIVQGNINVDPGVDQIDAFMITFRQFCSAGTYPCPASVTVSKPLQINGSVIALSSSPSAPPTPPMFVRNLTNGNATAAENIVYQAKYLAIFKAVFARTRSIWSELTDYTP